MTAFYDVMPQRARKVLMIIICAVTMALLAYFSWRAMAYVLLVRQLGSVSPALQFPLWIVYLLAPFGFALGALHYFLAFLRNLLSDGIWLSWSVRDEYLGAESAGEI